MQEFEQIYQAHYHEIFRFVYRILQSEQEAWELTQDTFVALFKEYQSSSNAVHKPRSWLYQVAQNRAYNMLRSRQRFTHAARRWRHGEETQDRQDPERQYAQAQAHAMVTEVLGEMRERDSLLLQLYASGLKYQEMAEVLQVQPNTIGKALTRAKEVFSKKLKKRGLEMHSSQQ